MLSSITLDRDWVLLTKKGCYDSGPGTIIDRHKDDQYEWPFPLYQRAKDTTKTGEFG